VISERAPEGGREQNGQAEAEQGGFTKVIRRAFSSNSLLNATASFFVPFARSYGRSQSYFGGMGLSRGATPLISDAAPPARRPANGEIFRTRATGCPLVRAWQPWSRYGLVPAVVRATSCAMALSRSTLLPHVSITYRKIDSDQLFKVL
jgi:hypothetical protein